MNSSAPQKEAIVLTPARNVSPDTLPWVPLGAGKEFKPLRFFSDNRGFAEILKLEPGTVVPLHRHTGEIHAYNLQGTRRLCTGETIGPGEFVFEPAGNVDSWEAVGDVPCIIFITVGGAVETLGDDGSVIRRVTGNDLRTLYEDHCRTNGLEIQDLCD